MFTVALLVAAVAFASPEAPPSYGPGTDVITLPRGGAELLQLTVDVTRVAIADTSVANVVVVSPREILINGVAIGSTTLIVWNSNDIARTYAIEVTADVEAIQRQFTTLFPGEDVQVTAQGNVVVLSGSISGGEIARRMVEIAGASGATVIRNFSCIRPSTAC